MEQIKNLIVYLKKAAYCELKLSLNRMLRIFDNFTVLMIISVTDPTHTMSKAQTYWICLKKEKREATQTTLG